MKGSMSILALTLTLSVGSAFGGAEDDVKVVFDRFVVAQNAHNVSAVRDLLWDSPDFLWITRGAPIWGRDAALKRFEALYHGTWKLSPDTSKLKVTRSYGHGGPALCPHHVQHWAARTTCA